MANLLDTVFNDTSVVNCPAGTTAQRPSSPVEGDFRYNTTINSFEFYDGATWRTAEFTNFDTSAGSSPSKPVRSGQEAYRAGQLTDGYVWVEIAGAPYLMEYSASDRYGTGELGWVNYSNEFFGRHYFRIPESTYGVPTSIIPAWNTSSSSSTADSTIGTGQLRIGREQSHIGGNSLSTVRCAVPLHTSLYYQLTDAVAGGNQTADFGTGWQDGNYGYNIFNNNTYQNNGNGYWCIMHSGNAGDTSNSTNRRILDPGNLRSQNGPWTTNNYETWGSQLDANYTPYIIWGTTDAYNEYAYIRGWNVWTH